MFIHYCDGCNIRVDNDESVTIGEKIYCKACAETKVPKAAAGASGQHTARSGGGSGFHATKIGGSGLHSRGINPPQRPNPATGTRSTPGTGMRHAPPPVSRGAPPRIGSGQMRATTVPSTRSAERPSAEGSKTAIWILALAGVVLAGLGLMLMSRKNPAPPALKKNPPEVAPATPESKPPVVVAPTNTTPKPVESKRPEPEPAKPRTEDVLDDIREGSAQRRWEEIQKSSSNPYEYRRRLEQFVQSNRSTKAGKEAAEKLKTLPPLPVRPPDKVDNTTPGLMAHIYEKNFEGDSLFGVNISGLKKIQSKVVPQISFNKDRYKDAFGREDNLTVSFIGYVEIPKDGTYTFYSNSDDASLLYFGDMLLVNNDGSHGAVEIGESIPLQAGKHRIKINYSQGHGDACIHVSWSGPDIPKQIIPEASLSHGNE
ncbi:MAG TPA: PA14 domain-containing protein [Planctomycetota bacterium]|nr:PA14 domain-containing protein [Planctomycetota bacterium]